MAALGLSAAALAAAPLARSQAKDAVECFPSRPARSQAVGGGPAAAPARRRRRATSGRSIAGSAAASHWRAHPGTSAHHRCPLALTLQAALPGTAPASRCRAAGTTSQDIAADVCILGAGIIGLCSALALLRADPALRVALVDRKVPCSGATGAGQGYLWLAHRDVHSPLFTMAAQSRQLWSELLAPAVPQLTAEALEWQPIGSLLIASTAGGGEALAQRQRLLTNAGLEDAQLLTAAEARRLEPALELGSEGSALLVPSDVQVNGKATAAALLQACQAHGPRFTALFNEGARKLLQGDSGRVLGVQTERRRIHAGRGVVVALGAWSGAFLADQMADVRWAAAFRPQRGLLLEMPRPGSMPPVQHGMMEVGYTKHYSQLSSAGAFTAYQTAEPEAAAGTAAAAAATGSGSTEGGEGVDITFTATTSKSGSLLVGSSREFAGFDNDAPEAVVQAIMLRAQHFLPGLAAVQRPDIHVRCGPRPYATAGSPIVDTVPGAEGVVVAAGHEGSGLTLAPATAALVADLVLGEPCGLEAEVIQAVRCPFRLSIEDFLSM